MKNDTKKTTVVDAKIESTKTKQLTIADVARELNIAPKRARTVLRKNAKQYAPFRKIRFDAKSKTHNDALAMLKSLFKTA